MCYCCDSEECFLLCFKLVVHLISENVMEKKVSLWGNKEFPLGEISDSPFVFFFIFCFVLGFFGVGANKTSDLINFL